MALTVDLTEHELLRADRPLHHLEHRRRGRLLRVTAASIAGGIATPAVAATSLEVVVSWPGTEPRRVERHRELWELALAPTVTALAAGLVDAGVLASAWTSPARVTGSGVRLPRLLWRGTPPVPTTRLELTLTAT